MPQPLLASALLVLLAQASIQVGQVRAQVSGQLTGDPGKQLVELRVTQVTPIGSDDAAWKAQLQIRNAAGGLIWRSPVDNGAFSFQGGPAGETYLQVAGPLEAAGQGEVVIQEMQSDVRVEQFRVLRWRGKGLAFVRSAGLVEQPARSGRFVWNQDSTPRNRWVSRFVKILEPGRCQVELSRPDGSKANATLKANASGFEL